MRHFEVWLVHPDMRPLRKELIANPLANIDGAVRVHDFATWPKTQKVFVFCNEPKLFAENGGLCGLPESPAIAYV